MAYDILIENAKICDGSGASAYTGSVAIESGKIAAVGAVSGSARRKINGHDLVVAPGFIDPHTHYDAQICWDPLLTSSCWHGITTVLMGNCGVGVAPCRPADREVLAWDLVNVEALPYEVLIRGASWDGESFGDYLATIERRGIALNAAFLVRSPHCASSLSARKPLSGPPGRRKSSKWSDFFAKRCWLVRMAFRLA